MKTGDVTWTAGGAFPDGVDGGMCPEAAPAEEAMDARVFLTDSSGAVRAQASLWWSATPMLDGGRVGAIGGFSAVDAASAAVLLDAACGRLRDEGCEVVVGPMNGNTWRRYRHVVESSGRGRFLLEPGNPESYPDWWRAAGFEVLAGYSSSVVPLDGSSTVPDSLEARLADAGVTIRDIDESRFEEELAAIHEVTLASFARNFLYTPLPKEPFIAAYRKIRDKVDPRFVRIAERDGKPCGYVFAIADLEAAARGEKSALIIKTLAVDPASRCAGLGSLLVDQVQRLGFREGYTEALHVLQFDGNNVLKITARHGGERFRRYELFVKRP